VTPLYDVSLEVTRWLQANYPQLESLMAVISALGRFEFYLAVVPLLYWCMHKQLGKELAYVLALTNMLNAMFKHFLRAPRPYWLEPELGLATETTYGIPSGHMQTVTVFYLFLAVWVRRTSVWLAALLAIFLMGLSRVYLGMHFIHDTVASLLLGLLILTGYFLWRHYFRESFSNRIMGQRLLGVVLVPLVLLLLYAGVMFALGAPDRSVPWSQQIPAVEWASMEETSTAVGILLGLGIGFILEATRVHFAVVGSWRQRALRYLAGMLVTVAIWRGLGSLFPDDPLWLALPLRVFRYWLAGMWVAYYAPLAFVRTGLAQTSPEPDVKLTVADGRFMRG
jgi:membrane-associated phospholipid phosphatase